MWNTWKRLDILKYISHHSMAGEGKTDSQRTNFLLWNGLQLLLGARQERLFHLCWSVLANKIWELFICTLFNNAVVSCRRFIVKNDIIMTMNDEQEMIPKKMVINCFKKLSSHYVRDLELKTFVMAEWQMVLKRRFSLQFSLMFIQGVHLYVYEKYFVGCRGTMNIRC